MIEELILVKPPDDLACVLGRDRAPHPIDLEGDHWLPRHSAEHTPGVSRCARRLILAQARSSPVTVQRTSAATSFQAKLMGERKRRENTR